MAVWVCEKCGFKKEARCSPQKCPLCGAPQAYFKKEEK